MIGEDNGSPLQYSCLENPMDRGAWWAAVHGAAKSWTRLSDFSFTFYFHALEKEMATHSSVLAWRIPGMAEPSGLPSMGLHRVRHGWCDLATTIAMTNGIEHFFLFLFFFLIFFFIFFCYFFLSLHVFPIPIPPPTSLSTRSLQVEHFFHVPLDIWYLL